MANYNKVIIAGHLCRDPELKYVSKSGTAVCNVTVAETEKWKDNEHTVFLDVTLWGKTAELCNEYLAKGSAVMFEGRLCQDNWKDKETGKNRTKIYMTAEKMVFLGKGAGRFIDNGGSGKSRGDDEYKGRDEPRQAQSGEDNQDYQPSGAGRPDDEVPF